MFVTSFQMQITQIFLPFIITIGLKEIVKTKSFLLW